MNFGIIGFGRFGQLWVRELAKHGQVLVCDKRKFSLPKNSKLKAVNLKQAAACEMVFLCVPISQIAAVCKQISQYLNPASLVLDTASVKVRPVVEMKKFLPKRQPIIATHPLFGPDSVRRLGTIQGLKIVVCPVRSSQAHEIRAARLFEKMGLKIIQTTPWEHDRQMAPSQGLVHFIGRGLMGLRLKHQEIATPDFETLLHIGDMVGHDTWQLFCDMQNFNPFAKSIRRKFLGNLHRMEQRINVPEKNLGYFRRRIEHLDKALIQILAQRKQAVSQISKLKRSEQLRIKDTRREQKLFGFYRKLAKQYRLDAKAVSQIFAIVLKDSRRIQRVIG
jgi:prephenate dehydrogenase